MAAFAISGYRTMNGNLRNSIIAVITSGFIFSVYKPSVMYETVKIKNNGRKEKRFVLRDFGTGGKHQTLLPLWLACTLVGLGVYSLSS